VVHFRHICHMKIKLHRLVEGNIKTISFKREADGWHGVLSCELPDAEKALPPLPATGIDLGLKVFLVTADGCEIAPPRYYRKAQRLCGAPSALSPASKREATGGRRRYRILPSKTCTLPISGGTFIIRLLTSWSATMA